MPAHAEAGGEAAVGHRLPHQEFLRALAGVVVEVDRAVGGIAEAVEAMRDVAERQRRVEDLGGFRRSVRAVRIGGIDDLQIVARRKPRLIVDVEGEDVDEALDDVGGHAERQPGAPQSVMQGGQRAGGARRIFLLGDLQLAVRRRLLRRDVGAVVGERDGRDVVVARIVEADAHRPDRAGVGIRGETDAHLLPGAEVEGEVRHQRRLDGGGGIRVGAFVHQHLAQRRALGDRQHLVLDAVVVEVVGLGEQRDVLRRERDGERVHRVRVGARQVEAGRIDVGKRGHLHRPVGEEGRRFAHPRLDLGKLERRRFVVDGARHREVDGLDLDLAVHLRAVDRIAAASVHRRRRRRASPSATEKTSAVWKAGTCAWISAATGAARLVRIWAKGRTRTMLRSCSRVTVEILMTSRVTFDSGTGR